MQKYFIYAIVLLLSNSCGHPSTEKDSVPITNNPDYTLEEREWEPTASDPWWKVTCYNMLKNSLEEVENNR